MSNQLKLQESSFEHKNLEGEFVGGIVRWSIISDIDWLDKTNRIYSELCFKKIWICGVLVCNKFYKVHHAIDSTPKGVGFGGNNS